LTKEEIMERDWNGRNGLLILRHADRPSLKGLGERADEVAITEKGSLESRALGQAVGQATAVVSSGVLRARQTAQEIMMALGRAPGSLRTFKSLCRLSASEADRVRYEDHKKRLGWKAFVDAWIDGSLGDSTSVLSSHASVMGALRELMAPDGVAQEGLTIAITHDFYVHALLEMMSGRRKWSGSGIPTLAGVYLDYDDARYLLKAYGA
jgi:broad specificity phosphatase PhoE